MHAFSQNVAKSLRFFYMQTMLEKIFLLFTFDKEKKYAGLRWYILIFEGTQNNIHVSGCCTIKGIMSPVKYFLGAYAIKSVLSER